MCKLLTNNRGVTLLEGVIALGLLALVAGGAFGVLLSASRQNTQPDIREEMIWAVEKAHRQLQAYVGSYLVTNTLPTNLQNGLCENGDTIPLNVGSHNIDCMLPPICDRGNGSSFSYNVETRVLPFPSSADVETSVDTTGYNISFTITCNGYKL